MSTQNWQHFLQTSAQQQPVLSPSDFNVDENKTLICDLSHLGLLQIEGADALTFLQGQVTNDVKKLDGTIAHYTGYCNAKGRLLGLFLAFAHGEHIHLQMPKELIAPIAKRLSMYVLRSQVKIQDVSDSIIKIGVSGAQAEALLAQQFSHIPQQAYALTTLEQATILRLPSATPRFEVFTSLAHAPNLWNALLQGASPVDVDVWNRLEIEAGIPEVYASTQEAFVPQMLNLDLLDGISFKKGCYTGQEIVARTHYLGTIKRRTFLTHSTQPLAAGDDVLNPAQEVVGKIVRTAPLGHDGYLALAELRIESAESALATTNGGHLTLRDLPYALTSTNA